MPTLHLWRVFLAISVVILMANVLFVDWIWLKDRQRFDGVVERVNQLTTAFNSLGITEEAGESGELNSVTPPTSLSADDMRGCGSVCQQVIAKKVAEAIDASKTPTASASNGVTAATPVSTTIVTKSGTYYIPLSGIGSTKERDWVGIPTTETIIDWSEYGSNYTITWDAYAKVYQGNGKTSLRLYDKTNAVEVANSNLETGSETSVHLVSGTLNVWSGKNTYIVQVKSLTGYEAFFESGRIKVVVK